jgi:Zn-dependent protease with chaperone function
VKLASRLLVFLALFLSGSLVWAGKILPVAVPPASSEALRYYQGSNMLWILGRLLALAIPAWMLWSQTLAGVRERARKLTGGSALGTAALVFLSYLLASWVLKLPFRFYVGYLRLHAYGLSNQTLLKWSGDALKGLGVGLILSLAIFLAVWGLICWSARRWWIWAGLLAVPASFFLVLVEPLWVAPLFNDFGSMQNKVLEGRIRNLARRSGIEGGRIFEVAKKVDTSRVNAYVAGFAGSKRIVLWDTLLERLNEDEVLFVMGHEMGHYVLRHVQIGLFLADLGALALFLGVSLLGGELLRRWGDSWRLEGLTDPAALPLVLLLVTILSWAGEPLGLWVSRHMEREADRFGIELTQNNHAAATAFVKLQVSNLGNPWPGPLFRFFRSTHPSAGERIEFCNRYRPWEFGKPLVYGKLFARDP